MVSIGLSTSSHLAQMVNVGFGPGGILGILIAVAGAGLYFLRSVRPELARDHDIFFAAVGVLCGGILFFQGWRLDPILMFGQLLLTGSAIFFAVESIRLRGVATEQARRNSQIIDEDRPVRPVYQAELYDELIPDEDLPSVPRIRGTRDSSRRATYVDELEGEVRPRRRSSSRGPAASGDRPPRKRPPRPDVGDGTAQVDSRNTPGNYAPSSRSSRSVDKSSEAGTRRPRKTRPRPPAQTDASTADYVDYQPLDYTDRGNDNRERDNSSNFDDDDQNW